ncbi:MAG: magnesium chelatase subunit D [Burkholderiales bacterium]|nr:magnesium chelatase subunit D [Burkholderiales bacterium]
MNAPAAPSATPDQSPALIAALLALDPARLGGVVIAGPYSHLRDACIEHLLAAWPESAPRRRLPVTTTDDRLLGGLDLAATLAAGRPVLETGVLGATHGGVIIVPMAERMPTLIVSRLAAALDSGSLRLERDGVSTTLPARVALIALDEARDDEAGLAPALTERLAFCINMDALAPQDKWPEPLDAHSLGRARTRLANIRVPVSHLVALNEAALAYGIDSLRAPLMAVWTARALAALEEADTVDESHIAQAAALVFSHRATRMPAVAEAEPPDDAAEPPAPPPESASDTEATEDNQAEPTADETERLLEAVRAALPPGLLAALAAGNLRSRQRGAEGRAGTRQRSPTHGRSLGATRMTGRGGRVHVLATLREAAPRQALRRSTQATAGKIRITRDDLRVHRFESRRALVTVFVVDASGSSALHRLAEAKGAVELLLADCYVRRDRVALIAFRGSGAEMLLPPTRALARARRSLAGLPGGGGTPLAAGLDAALDVCERVQRAGDRSAIVLLTDGRANIARDGAPGRERAEADARASARNLRAAGIPTLLVDTSPRPQPFALALAAEIDGLYLPLPHADARLLNQAVRATAQDGRTRS